MSDLWKFFFFCGHSEDYDLIHERLVKGLKEDALYVMSHEVAEGVHHRFNGSHYHFMVQIENKEYHSLAKWFKDRYSLNGKAQDGNSREYGVVKSIKDTDKAIQYILKEGNYKSNMDTQVIQNLYELSFKKKTQEKDFIEELFQYIKEKILIQNGRDPSQLAVTRKGGLQCALITGLSFTKRDICVAIIDYYRLNPKIGQLSRALIQRLYERFLIYGSKMDSDEVYNKLFEIKET